MLNSSTNTLKSKPEDLYRSEDANESISFIPVPNRLAVDPRELDETVFHKVVDLVSVDRKARIVRRVKCEATHVGEKDMRQSPFGMSELRKLIHRVSRRKILDLREGCKELGKDYGECKP